MTSNGDIDAFRRAKADRMRNARQTAALFLLCGIDLDAALRARGAERRRIVQRLGRLMERERIKGARRHWSYDLNRHIALAQALERLRGEQRREADAQGHRD